MSETETLAKTRFSSPLDALIDWARETTKGMCRTWAALRKWERERILTGLATAKERADHKEALKMVLRYFKWLDSLVSDPDFRDHSIRATVQGIVWQAEQSWKQIYEPMPDAEADQILAEVFPDEQRA